MNHLSIYVILPLSLIIGFLLNEGSVNKGEFELEGRCSLTVLNNTEDSINILITNWYHIPSKLQEIDSTLAPNFSLTFNLTSQNNNYYDLSIDSVEYKIFSQPGSADTISIMENSIVFSGNLKPVNDFLLKKAKKFNSIDADWLSRVGATSGSEDFEEVIEINDAITKNHIRESKIAYYIKDEGLKKFLYSELASIPVLPLSTELPYFYLADTSNVAYESSQFKGKILLINFWATWCKPCIKEFPYENELIERFEGEPVLVLNICIDSDPDKWKGLINKHGLKTVNLIAEDNWNKKLSKDFDIQGLPHSVLVDWNGKVVQNKCPPASKSYELIAEQLAKMKAEK